MKHLIIFTHPNTQSLCHLFCDKIVEGIKGAKQDYEIVDLYKIKFQPVLDSNDFTAMNQNMVLKDVQVQQDKIRESKHLTLIFPLWWASVPAILKGYIDRVFSFNFAYKTIDGVPIGLLHDIKVNIVFTMGSKLSDYEAMGADLAIKKCIDQLTFKFCGVKVYDWFIFSDTNNDLESRIQPFADKLKTIYQKKLAFVA